jgi:2-oxoisovalerate dehydrogenase E1 component alpha subunit
VESEVDAANSEAQRSGVHSNGPHHDPATIFEDIYKDMPRHLHEQQAEMQRLRTLRGVKS